MLDIVLNEQKIINAALNDKIIDDIPTKTLRVLIKHYYLQGMEDKITLKEQLLYFMEQNYTGYKRSKWEKSVDGIVNRFIKNINKYKVKIQLTNIESVNVTQSELDKITEIRELVDLDDLSKKNLEKICFIILIYAKISNQELNNKEGWINKSCSTILKEARVNLKGDEKKRIFNHLYNLGYISQRAANDKTSMKINFIDVEEVSDVVITVDDFENVLYYFLNWKGEKWRRCEYVNENKENCNKWFKLKSPNSNQKYCNICAKISEKYNTKERVRIYRKRKCNET